MFKFFLTFNVKHFVICVWCYKPNLHIVFFLVSATTPYDITDNKVFDNA